MSPFLLGTIMINVFKAGGNYKTKDGTAYSVKTINECDRPKFIIDGWVLELSLIDVIEEGVFEEIEPEKTKKIVPKKVS